VVVGAGVSGCACAAVLAEMGQRVTVVNPALDHVGEPCFGPLVGGVGRLAALEVLEGLPSGLREAWLGSALVSAKESLLTIDRRMVSVETKRALEQMPGLEFRQGLVTGLYVDDGRAGAADDGNGVLRVETVFGEELSADAVVVAVGLGLVCGATGGRAAVVGRHTGQGTTGEGLTVALQAMGAEFALGETGAGPSFGGSRSDTGDVWLGKLSGTVTREDGEPVGELVSVGLERMMKGKVDWPTEYPPSPYRAEELWRRYAVAERLADGALRAVLVPDGLATGEMALAVGYGRAERCNDEAPGPERLVVSRPSSWSSGLVVMNTDLAGRFAPVVKNGLGLWVTGRAAGASEYLESLRAGARTGEAVARFLRFADG
jgi:hypothetical protein